MDVALHAQPVTVVLDRGGVTGSDGPSHNGMWDFSLLAMVPGIRVAAPRDASSLREQFREAVAIDDGPSVVRYPKGAVIPDIPAMRRVGGVDVLREPGGIASSGIASGGTAEVLLVCVGAFGEFGLEVADRLAVQGVTVTVVDPRWVLPVPQALIQLASAHPLVVTLEDGGEHGGVGCALGVALRHAELDVALRTLALPQRFLEHGSRADVLASVGLRVQDVARRVSEWTAALPVIEHGPSRTGAPLHSGATPATQRPGT